MVIFLFLRIRNIRLVPGRFNLASWEEGASLALVDQPSGDGSQEK